MTFSKSIEIYLIPPVMRPHITSTLPPSLRRSYSQSSVEQYRPCIASYFSHPKHKNVIISIRYYTFITPRLANRAYTDKRLAQTAILFAHSLSGSRCV